MSFYNTDQQPSPFEIAKSQLIAQQSFPFNELLPEDVVQQAFDEVDANFEEDEDIIFTPTITLWGFLSQMLFKDEHRSCTAAVAQIAILLVALEKEPCAGDTAAFCRARLKLKEEVIERLMLQLATAAESTLPAKWLWKNRHIKLVDGTTMSMPDTIENQQVYPQQKRQKRSMKSLRTA